MREVLLGLVLKGLCQIEIAAVCVEAKLKPLCLLLCGFLLVF